MVDDKFSVRSRDPVMQHGPEHGLGKGDPLAGLAWLLHQSDHKCAPRDTQARAPPSEHGVAGQRSGSSNSEQRPDGQGRDNGPPHAEPRFYSNQKKSASLAVENGLREDTSEHPAVVPASLGRNDRLSVLPVAQPPTFLRTESVNRDGPDFKAAQIGETYGADHYSDDTPGPRWRGALMVVMAVLAFAIVGTVGALGYGVMFSRSVVPPVASIIRALGANSIVPRYGKTWPSKASAGPNEKVTSREEPPGDQEVPKRVPRVISAIPISPNPNTPEPATSEWAPDPPLAPREEADTLAPAPSPTAAAAPAAASPALSPPSGATASLESPGPTRASAPNFSESKKIDLVSNRADMSAPTDTVNATGYGTTDASTAAAKPEPAEALGVEKPLMALAPNAHDWAAPPSPSRSGVPIGTGSAGESSLGLRYAVQLASELSAAEAHASFWALRAKFQKQLGGREPIVRRTDLGAKGVYYRVMVGPFASMEKAAGMCSTLKAAGCKCLVLRI